MSEELTPEKISTMKVRELKTALRQLGLPQNGNKATLQKRLNEYIISIENDNNTQDNINENNNEILIENESTNINDNLNDNNTINTESVIDITEQEKESKNNDELITNNNDINNDTELREDTNMDMNSNNNSNNNNDNDSENDVSIGNNQLTLSQISQIEMEFRRKQRLQRFGAVTETDKREIRKRRFNDMKMGNNDFSLGSIMNTNNDSVSNIANKIKLRQQKFGTNNINNFIEHPNKRLKLMDKQKIEERKQRFGLIDEEEKIKMRKDRFGMISEKDKILQRKQRFNKNNTNDNNNKNGISKTDFNKLKQAGKYGLMHVDATLDDIAKFNQQRRNNGRGRGRGNGRIRGRGRGNYIKRGNMGRARGRGQSRGKIINGINSKNGLKGQNINSSNNVIFSDF